MNDVKKFLKTLKGKKLDFFLLLIEQIERDYSKIPGIKKLSRTENYYRIRVGRYRIIFCVYTNGETEVIRIAKRDERTYKNL